MEENIIRNSNIASDIKCTENIGLTVNLSDSKSIQILKAQLSLPKKDYFNAPTNRSYHNLCTTITPPPGLRNLLGLGLKFCIRTPRPSPNLPEAIERLVRQVRTYDWASKQPGINIYDKKLYARNEEWVPDPIEDGKAELQMLKFANELTNLAKFKEASAHRATNLNRLQQVAMKNIRNQKLIKIVECDKGLGPASIETIKWNKHIYLHLNDTKNFTRLPEVTALRRLKANTKKCRFLTEKAFTDELLPEHEDKFFVNSYSTGSLIKGGFKIPHCYITMKIHKATLQSRLIISARGTMMSVASRWCDKYLQKMMKFCPTKLKDVNELMAKIKKLGPLPPSTVIFTYDAEKLYPTIQIGPALKSIKWWLNHLKDKLPEDFCDHDLLINLLTMVMTQNIFQFDDVFYIQINGTAAGTNSAPPYAELFLGHHEETILIPKYKTEFKLLERFIDDGICLWNNPAARLDHDWTKDEKFQEFIEDLPFDNIKFTHTLPSKEAVFMDLRINLVDGNAIFSCYEKPQSLHLYIPPTSAHAPANFRGLIHTMIIRYWRLNTLAADFRKNINQFFERMVAAGHNPEYLKKAFIATGEKIMIKERLVRARTLISGTDTATKDTDSTLYFKWPYHPRGIQARDLQMLFEKHLKGHVGFTKMIVALTRPKNLRDLCTNNRVQQEEGKKASQLFSAWNSNSPS